MLSPCVLVVGRLAVSVRFVLTIAHRSRHPIAPKSLLAQFLAALLVQGLKCISGGFVRDRADQVCRDI